MRTAFLALWILIGSFGPSVAQEPPQGAIETVIRSQIDAFQTGELERAFDFASDAIRGKFRTPERFGQMVAEGYPMVWRPDAVRFGALEMRGNRVLQTVILRDAAGVTHALEYEMIPVGDGWKINGVRPLAPPAVGA